MSPISLEDQKIIEGDANIAVDRLESIIYCCMDGNLHPNYIKEKISVVKSCIEFIESFVGE